MNTLSLEGMLLVFMVLLYWLLRKIYFSKQKGIDMTNSKRIAALIGPTLVALTLSEAMKLPIWATNSAPVTYLNGILLWVAGLSIVRAHNQWITGWPVLVTLVGWALILIGLWRMFFPEAQQGGENIATYGVLTILFVIGIMLTLKAYGPQTGGPADH